MPAKSHGMSRTRFYGIWKGMNNRCRREQDANYGGRGIEVCERWKTFQSFMDDMYASYQEHAKIHGEENTSIERNDVDGNYEPSNTRWATMSEQNANKRARKGAVKGVDWVPSRKKWRVRHEQRHLGYANSVEEAVQILQKTI